MGAKKTNKIDVACVVFADVDNAGRFTFLYAFDAIEIQPKLEAIPTRTGRFGEYWLLAPSLVEANFDFDAAEDAW